MAMQDGKYFSLNISVGQAAGLVAILVVAFLIIYFDAVILGYVLAVFALSAFFLVVGFDIGLPKKSVETAGDEYDRVKGGVRDANDS